MTRTPPKMTRPAYHVWLDPRPDLTGDSPDLDESELSYHYVVVNNSDQLRAELEAKRHMLGKPQDTPMHLTALWLWASLVRTGRYDGNFASFKLACVTYDPDQDADPADTDPDPTEASIS